VSSANRARQIAAGGGAVGVLGGVMGLLWAQALLAKHRVGRPRGVLFPVDGRYLGPDGDDTAPAYRMLMLGDSGAAGLGSAAPQDTPAVVVASGLAAATGRPVDLVNLAVVGAQTSGVLQQVEQSPSAWHGETADVAVIMVGANDVTHAVRPQVSIRNLDIVVRSLRDAGSEVVVACCPDLGTVEPVPNPLRTIGRRLSRTLAAAQALATSEAGGHPVQLAAILGPEFASRPGEYFSEDRFHPSSMGYRRAGEVILPTVLQALGVSVPS
jgi:lysophospholipase L1-like esterase